MWIPDGYTDKRSAVYWSTQNTEKTDRQTQNVPKVSMPFSLETKQQTDGPEIEIPETKENTCNEQTDGQMDKECC